MMNNISYLNKESDLELFQNLGIKEVLLGGKTLSRKGRLSFKRLLELAQAAKNRGFICVLEWDILATEKEFSFMRDFFSKLDLDLFDKVRVQDPGVLEFVLTHSHKPIQWITEHGNHNLLGLKKWEDYIGLRLDRFIISHQLPYDKIKLYQKALKTPVEILLLGKILLFYTPRHLLTPLNMEKNKEGEVWGQADSEESPHKEFFVVENTHGTFMYHLKDLCLLPEVEKRASLQPFWGRVELCYIEESLQKDILKRFFHLQKTFSTKKYQEFKEIYPIGLTKGFFPVNKSDVIFKKLKNYRLLRSDKSYIGEVIDVVKGYGVVVEQKSRTNFLALNKEVCLMTPEGKKIIFMIDKLQTLSQNPIEKAKAGQYVLLSHKKGITAKTVVSFSSKS